MTEKKQTHRSPAAFPLDDDERTAPVREPAQFENPLEIIHEAEDPFLPSETSSDGALEIPAPKRRFPLFRIVAGALGVVFSLAFGLWSDQLVRDLFTRSDWLGYLAMGALGVLILALLAYIGRELAGLASLRNVDKLRVRLRDAARSGDEAVARSAVKTLSAHLASRPETASGRASMDDALGDIIDNAGLVKLAEAQLLQPLDLEARQLIANAARRVSIVTAVSPRALTDIGYVLFEAARLVRTLSALYGGRPGFFGLIKLLRSVVAHLAVTGTIALGDSVIQQLLGHGLASKVSARLGEGVANGLMTARIGIAAMELARPMDFVAEKRPKVTDFLNVLSPSGKTRC